MDREVCPGFSAIERISVSATYHVQTRGGWGFVCLHRGSLPHDEFGTNTGWWRCI